MSRRIDIELTSAQPDGRWTWRAAGARQPKGVLDGQVLYDGAKAGDVVRAEAEFEIDGIVITSVLPPREKSQPDPERIELLGPSEPVLGGVTTQLVSRSDRRPERRDGDRRPGRRDRDAASRGGPGGRPGAPRGSGPGGSPERAERAGSGPRDRGPRGRATENGGSAKVERGSELGERSGPTGRPERGDRGEQAARPERSGRPERAERSDRPERGRGGDGPGGRGPGRGAPDGAGAGRGPRRDGGDGRAQGTTTERSRSRRLNPAYTHRQSVVDALPAEQRPVAEQLLRGGIPAVRTAISLEREKATAEGRPAPNAEQLLLLAENLLPGLKTAEWHDRAEAAVKSLRDISLRDLRSVVAGADAARDDETRALAGTLREALDSRVTTLRDNWTEEIERHLAENRVVRALRLSGRPPETSSRLPGELSERLSAAAGAALSADASGERWLAVLEAVAESPVRRSVRPAGLPNGASPEVTRAAHQQAGRVPALAALLGIAIPPPPGPRRPGATGPIRPTPAPAGAGPAGPPAPTEAGPASPAEPAAAVAEPPESVEPAESPAEPPESVEPAAAVAEAPAEPPELAEPAAAPAEPAELAETTPPAARPADSAEPPEIEASSTPS